MFRSLRLWSARLAVALLGLSAHAAMAAEMVSVNRDRIHMRAGPGTKHESKWMLGQGYPLEVTGRSGQWLKVRDFERDIGWVYRPLVSKRAYHVVKAPVANLRSAPSPRARVVGRLEYGETLRTLQRKSGWVKVREEGGRTGWVSRSLLWGW